MKVVTFLVFILFFCFELIYAQEIEQPDTIKTKIWISENKFRSTFGLLNPFLEDESPLRFLNLSYRHSKLSDDYIERNYGHGFSLEIGLNFLVNPEENVSLFNFFMGYLKGGPEIRLIKDIYADFHIGLACLYVESHGLGAVPFIGVNIGYSMTTLEGINFEVETGANIAIGAFFPLIYVMFGFSF